MTRRSRQPLKAFTLVEMAFVIVIVGLIALSILPVLQAEAKARAKSLTDANLQNLLRATTAFVQAHGCLPCPNPASVTGGAGFGRVRGDTNAALCGTCATAEGVAPFVSLGIPQSQAKDGWQRWITMRIDPTLTSNPIAPAIVAERPPTSPCTAADITAAVPSCTLVGMAQKGLCQNGLTTTTRVQIQTPGGATQQAAVLYLSHGENGRGAFNLDNAGTRYAIPTAVPACSAGAGHERCNADGDRIYVHSGWRVDDTDPFDDVLSYLDRNNLVSFLGQATCQTVW
jgi:type II secretory pathway pseudopilin PulG